MSNPTTKYIKKRGTRNEVWKGIARETSGGLKKQDLMISKTGSVVSKKASQSASERMKKGQGICSFCIEQYKKGLIGDSTEEKKQQTSKKPIKEKEIVIPSPEKVKELEKEIEEMRKKVLDIVERTGKETKETKKLSELVKKKVREKIMMVKKLKELKNKK